MASKIDLEKENEGLKRRVSELETGAPVVQNDEANLAEIGRLKANLATAYQEIDSLQTVYENTRSELVKMQSTHAELDGTNKQLFLQVTELTEENETLRDNVGELRDTVSSCPSGDHAVYRGRQRKIVDADLAWEIGQKVEKSFVDEDATCLVLDHHGG